MAATEELVQSAVDSARTARETLASAGYRIRQHAPASLAEHVTRAIAALYVVETSDAAGVYEAITDAMAHLQKLLQALQEHGEPTPNAEEVTPQVAHTLAMLHPLQSELERALSAADAQGAGNDAPLGHRSAASRSEAAGADAGPAASAPQQGPSPPSDTDSVIPLERPRRSSSGGDGGSLSAGSSERAPAKPKLEIVSEGEDEPASFDGAEPVSPGLPGSGVAPSAELAHGSTERRLAPRVDLEVGIGYQSENNFFTGFSGDISEGGVFVATYDYLGIGNELTLSLVLPDGPQIITRGRVVWVREPHDLDADLHPGMGVQFLELSEEGRTAIMRFTEKRDPIFHES